MKIKMKNFRRFQNKEIKFQEGVNLLSGKNGQGKSTVVQAIQYALFGSSALPYSVESIQNIFSDIPVFEVEFKYENNIIVRGGERAEFNGVTGHTAVTNAVENLFKINQKTFVISNCINQGELNLLTAMRPSERIKYIKKLFNLESLEQAVKEIDEDRKEKNRDFKYYKERLEELQERVNFEVPEHSKEYLEKRKQEIEQELKEIDEIKALAIQRKNLEEELGNFVYTPLAITVEEWKRRFKNLDEIRVLKKEYLKIKQEFNEKELEKLTRLEQQVEQLKDEINSLKSKLYPYKQYLNEEYEELTEEEQVIAKEFALSYRSSFSSTLICPVCGDEITHCNSCGADFSLIKSAVTKLKIKKAKEIQNELLQKQQELEEIEKKFNQERLNELRYLNKQREKFAIRDLTNDFALLDEVNKYPSFDELVYTEHMNNIWEKLQKLPNVEYSEDKEHQLKVNLQNVNRLLLQWEQYDKLKDEYERLKKIVDEKQKEAALYKATHKKLKEFATYMTEKILPAIRENTITFFNLLTNNKFEKVEIDNKFNVFVEGRNIYEILSGGEQNLINLALRLGIAKTLKSVLGSKFDVLILDEVTGAFDDERSKSVMEQISMLKNFFRYIIVITHKEVDKEFADYVIDL